MDISSYPYIVKLLIFGLFTIFMVLYYVFFAASIALVILIIITLWTPFTDAPFVPTGKKTRRKMFEFAKIKEGERVYDLGCGDGRFVFEAHRLGARATGVEKNFAVYLLARFRQWRLKSKGLVIRGNICDFDLGDADVIFCYLLPRGMKKLDKKFKAELKKGTRVISRGFELPEWTPVESYHSKINKLDSVFKYVVD